MDVWAVTDIISSEFVIVTSVGEEVVAVVLLAAAFAYGAVLGVPD